MLFASLLEELLKEEKGKRAQLSVFWSLKAKAYQVPRNNYSFNSINSEVVVVSVRESLEYEVQPDGIHIQGV